MADPNRKLDEWTDAARTVTGAGAPVPDVAAADDRRLLALHEALREPPMAPIAPTDLLAPTTPDLVPIVMARIARRAASAPTPAGADAASAAGATARIPSGSMLDRLRDFLSHLALGPVAAVGSLAAVLAFALWSAGDDAAAGSLSGAAAGVAVPSLVIVALTALAAGIGVLWLRRR